MLLGDEGMMTSVEMAMLGRRRLYLPGQPMARRSIGQEDGGTGTRGR